MTKSSVPLVDAQKMHRLHPRTFKVPSKNRLSSIKKGDFVQISNTKDRFWVHVTRVRRPHLEGIVDNNLVHTQNYDAGDTIIFHQSNVYDIIKKRT